jgi:hypothetical protein
VIQESYQIIYEVLSDPPQVYILRFWHAARGLKFERVKKAEPPVIGD